MNITEARKVVRICYEIILNRTPNESEIDHWSKTIVNKKWDDVDVIYEFVSSKEFANMRGKDGKK